MSEEVVLTPVTLEQEGFSIPDAKDYVGLDKTDPALSEDIDKEYVYPDDPAPPGKKWVLADDDGTGPIAYQVAHGSLEVIKKNRPLLEPPYATVIENRTPKVKYYTDLGRAKNSIAYSQLNGPGVRGGQLYHWSNTYKEYQLLYDVAQGTLLADMPWRNEDRLTDNSV